MDSIQTTTFVQSLSNFTYRLWMMRGEILLNLGHGVKCQGQLWHSVYKAFLAQYRLQFMSNHFQTSHVDDARRNPIDFGSRGHRSRSTLPPCEGMPRFALSSYFWHKKTNITQVLIALRWAIVAHVGSLCLLLLCNCCSNFNKAWQQYCHLIYLCFKSPIGSINPPIGETTGGL